MLTGSPSPTETISRFALTPSQFPVETIPPEWSDEAKQVSLRQYIYLDVLPGAESEVAVPFLEATGCDDIQEFADLKLAGLDAVKRGTRVANGLNLWKEAVLKFQGVTLNTATNSNSDSYDKDAMRLQKEAEASLQKLLGWARAVVASGSDTGEPSEGDALLPKSSNLQAVLVP